MTKRFPALLLLALLPAVALAWWNADWKARKKITINTTEQGVALKEAVGPVVIPIRLHTGNFLFVDAKPDGSDIRFVASDDKTPLRHQIELFDSTNQLAIIWVQLPRLAPNSATDHIWMYAGNEKAPAGVDPKSLFDGNQVLVVNGFNPDGTSITDRSSYANPITGTGVTASGSGIIGGALQFQGGPLTVASTPGARVPANGGITFSAWIRPAASQTTQLFAWGPLQVALQSGRVVARYGNATAQGGAVTPGEWTHVAVTVSDRLAIYVAGAEVAATPAAIGEVSGNMTIGAGFTGEMDFIGVSNVARSPELLRVDAAQGVDGRLLNYSESETDSSASGGQVSHLKVLIDNLSIDAWVVIGILGIMFAISALVMFTKALFLARSLRANERFRDEFDALGLDVVKVARAARGYEILSALPPDKLVDRDSQLNHMYKTAVHELGIRTKIQPEMIERTGLSPQTMESIRATVDATLVRERQRLDSRLVLLTISISGGPFLGLLGTVVGVMIVFAAVAAAGDVNINAIAPGIAAALLATVAGLGVAIPCLFGYNYLASQVKSITADMQVFSDEMITKLAERFVPRDSSSAEPVREVEMAV